MMEMKFILISCRKMLSPIKVRHQLFTAPSGGKITKTYFRLAIENIIESETVYDSRTFFDEHYMKSGLSY